MKAFKNICTPDPSGREIKTEMNPRIFEKVGAWLARFPFAICCYLLPGLSPGFDEEAYIGTSLGPSGWWVRFPRLHYCLFNPPGKNLTAKYDGLDSSRPTVLFVTKNLLDTGANAVVMDLFRRHATGGNVVVISLGEGSPQILSRCISTVFPPGLAKKDFRFLVTREIGLIASRVRPVFGIVSSIDCIPALEALWRENVPAIHILEDSGSDPLVQDDLCLASCFPGPRIQHYGHFLSRPDAFEKHAIDSKRRELLDRAVIRDDGCFNGRFAYPRLADRQDLALNYYTSSWKTGVFRRKPFPGFHPGIYADHHSGLDRDPLAGFILSGKPAGAWLSEIVGPHSPETTLLSIKAALHLHFHFTDPADAIFRLLAQSAFRPDLFITVTSEAGKRTIAEKLFEYALSCSSLRLVPNRGRDIGPLFTGCPELFSSGYDAIGHIHGKKSDYMKREEAQEWTRFLYDNLLGSSGLMLANILKAMQANEGIGLVFPDDPSVFDWDDNFDHAISLWETMGLGQTLKRASFNFPAGTMFWARPEALKPLVDLGLEWQDYPAEPLGSKGTMLHAIERLLPFVVEKQGYRWAVTHVPGVTR